VRRDTNIKSVATETHQWCLSYIVNYIRLCQRHKKVLKSLVKCLVFLFDFNQTSFFTTDFNKSPQYKISQKSVEWEPSCSMRTSGQTDRYDEANTRFFATSRTRLIWCEDLSIAPFSFCCIRKKVGSSCSCCANGTRQTTPTAMSSNGISCVSLGLSANHYLLFWACSWLLK
jgi:hypothetical protein